MRLRAAGCGRVRSRNSRRERVAIRVAGIPAPLLLCHGAPVGAALDHVLDVVFPGHAEVLRGHLGRVPPPGRDQKDQIRGIYQRHYGLDAKQARPDDANRTRAEIKGCCRLASLLDVPLVQAAQHVVPVAVTAGDKIEGLRQWASGRCLSADRAGVYSRPEGNSGGRVRRMVREPGVN